MESILLTQNANNMRLSVSQLKKFNASKAQWAGEQILWVKDVYEKDSLLLWNLFENYVFEWNDNYELLKDKLVVNMETLVEKYDNLKHNFIGLSVPKWVQQLKIEWQINGVDFKWYIDNVEENNEVIWDIKTSTYLNKCEYTNTNSWSWLSYYAEYELQMWVYMKLWGYKTGKIAEVAKHKYVDGRNANQIITFERSDAWDKKMESIWFPKIDEMVEMLNRSWNIK